MIGIDNNLAEFLTTVKLKNACDEAIVAIEAMIVKNMTVRDFIFDCLERGGDRLNWLFWVRQNIPDALTPAARRAFSDAASNDNPRLAAHWCFFGQNVTQTEFDLLRAKWDEESLPNIHAQWAAGQIKTVR